MQGYQWYRGSTNQVKNNNDVTTGYGNPLGNNNQKSTTRQTATKYVGNPYGSGPGGFRLRPDLITPSTNTQPKATTAPAVSNPVKNVAPVTSNSSSGQKAGRQDTSDYRQPAAQPVNSGSGSGGGSSYSRGSSGGSSGGSSSASAQVDYAAQQAAQQAAAQRAAEEAAAAEAERQRQAQLEAIRLAIEAQKRARQNAIDAANAALDKQAQLARDRYAASKAQVAQDYQDLKNQNSINQFKAQKATREAQADRGAFGSGLGMQENLALSANYNNNLNKINMQEQNQYANLLNNLNSYQAQIDTQKANNQNSTLDNYNNVISSLINAAYSGYTPDSGYLALAQSLAGTPTVATPTNVASTAQAGLASNDLYDILLRNGRI